MHYYFMDNNKKVYRISLENELVNIWKGRHKQLCEVSFIAF
jgi:hypothetical protein